MSVNLKVGANPTRTYPQRGDNINYGTQATLWAQDVTAALNAIGVQFDWVLGSAAQVTAGTANFSDLATLVADAAVLDGHSVLVLTNTFDVAATIDINKRLTIICQSSDCIFQSTAGFAAGAIIEFSAASSSWYGGIIFNNAGTPDYAIEVSALDVTVINTQLTGPFVVDNLLFTGAVEPGFTGLLHDGSSSDIHGRWGLGSNSAQTIMKFFGRDGDGTALDNSAGLRCFNGVIQFKDRGGNWTGFAAVVSANTALSNLGATAVNASIIPDADSAYDLGANLLRWLNIYVDNLEGDTVVADTSVDAGNIQVIANSIISTNAGGDITIAPDTTGVTHINNVDSYETSEVAITAHAGGGQALAYALTAKFSQISVCATAADSVVLPAAFSAGYRMTIANDGTERADVYPASGDTIEGMVADAPIQLLPGQRMMVEGLVTDTSWIVL